MTYYVTIITNLGSSKDVVINIDRKLSIKELWKTVNNYNCKAMYATSDKNKTPIDIKYHYYYTNDEILKLMNI